MTEPTPLFDIKALSESGLLWLINKTVFHPRGYALEFHFGSNDETADNAVDASDSQFLGWTLIGDGSHGWSFPHDIDDEMFLAVQEFFKMFSPPAPAAMPIETDPNALRLFPIDTSDLTTVTDTPYDRDEL